MPKISKKDRQQFAERMLEELNKFEVSDLVIHGLSEAGPYAEGVIATPFGPVSFSVYDDWVPMQLKHHPGFVNGSRSWFGFDHWKVNFHTSMGQLAKKDRLSLGVYVNEFIRHLNHFFEGPFPTKEQYDAAEAAYQEKEKKWENIYKNWKSTPEV